MGRTTENAVTRTLRLSLSIALYLPMSGTLADEGFTLALDSPVGKRLSNTPQNGWVQLNINQFRDVWTPLDQRPAPPEASSVGGPWSIINAWSSMAWDNNRGQLIFWGGGHANYPGNDVYRWDASTLRWHRASLPSEVYKSPDLGTGDFFTVDGVYHAPIAAHTYDSSEFLPIADRFITFGGAAFNTGKYFTREDGSPTGPYMWDPNKADGNAVGGSPGSQVNAHIYTNVSGGLMWDNRDNLEPPSAEEPRPGYSGRSWIYGSTAYVEENGRDTLLIQVGADLYRYTVNDVNSAAADTYERLSARRYTPISGQGAGGYDHHRKIFVRSAGRVFSYWHLEPSGDPVENVVFTPTVIGGMFDFSALGQYGLDYDPVRRHFLLWRGREEVWRLTPPENLETGSWTLRRSYPVSLEAPYLYRSTGILGKWKYAPALDVFLGAFDKDEGQIWAYKPVNWQPAVDDPLPFLEVPRNNAVYDEGEDVVIEIESLDPSVASVNLYANGLLLARLDDRPFRHILLAPPAGLYTLQAVATGGDGITRESTTISISVGISEPGAEPEHPFACILEPAQFPPESIGKFSADGWHRELRWVKKSGGSWEQENVLLHVAPDGFPLARASGGFPVTHECYRKFMRALRRLYSSG